MVYQHPVRYLRLSQKKLQEISRPVLGMSATVAQEYLSVQNQKSAKMLATAIGAAVNNAKQEGVDLDTMVIIGIMAQKGPIFMRRFIVSKGRTMPKRKPTAHTRIIFGNK